MLTAITVFRANQVFLLPAFESSHRQSSLFKGPQKANLDEVLYTLRNAGIEVRHNEPQRFVFQGDRWREGPGFEGCGISENHARGRKSSTRIVDGCTVSPNEGVGTVV
jgi:hypothetical protein